MDHQSFAYRLEEQCPETQMVQRYDGALELSDAEEIALIRAHLARALEKLEEADISRLTPEQRSHRAQSIEALREYRTQGEFPLNRDFFGVRMPYFVDAEGTRCAMGHLIDVSGYGHLTDHVKKTNNNAKVKELVGEPALIAWLDQHGMTAEEAALVQPSYRSSIDYSCARDRGLFDKRFVNEMDQMRCVLPGCQDQPASNAKVVNLNGIGDSFARRLAYARIESVLDFGLSEQSFHEMKDPRRPLDPDHPQPLGTPLFTKREADRLTALRESLGACVRSFFGPI